MINVELGEFTVRAHRMQLLDAAFGRFVDYEQHFGAMDGALNEAAGCVFADEGYYVNTSGSATQLACTSGSYVTDTPGDKDGSGVSQGGVACELCPQVRRSLAKYHPFSRQKDSRAYTRALIMSLMKELLR